MTADPSPQLAIDWAEWLRRWDAQQTAYLPEREARFTAMLDVLADLLPASFVALDLASGPGAISQRLLARFPEARAVAVDLDPMLLAMGQAVLGDQGGQLRWVTADLEQEDWVARLGETTFDVVLSTTALHWLPANHLVHLYHELAPLIRPGGLFLNGDHLPFAADLPTFRHLSQAAEERQWVTAFEREGREDWASWWDAVRREPGIAPLMTERDRRFATHTHHDSDAPRPTFRLHVAALRDAGFREVGSVWQRRDDRVLLAVR